MCISKCHNPLWLTHNICLLSSHLLLTLLLTSHLTFHRSPAAVTCTHLEAVVGPGAELHHARLLVEGEKLHIDLTRRLVDRWGLPLHQAVVVESGLGGECHLEVTVGAVRGECAASLNLFRPKDFCDETSRPANTPDVLPVLPSSAIPWPKFQHLHRYVKTQ